MCTDRCVYSAHTTPTTAATTPPPHTPQTPVPRVCACSCPVVAGASATSSTSATLLLNPPASGVAVSNYTATACPISGGACITQTCQTINCAVTGLDPATTYSISSTAVTAGGVQLPASSPVLVTTAAGDAPTVTAAQALSSTTALVSTGLPSGSNFSSVRPQTDITAPLALWLEL